MFENTYEIIGSLVPNIEEQQSLEKKTIYVP